MSNSKRICFVCMGNICRSPLAEAVFRKLAQEAGLDGRYKVDSAGTIDYHIGEAPDSRMQRVAQGHGVQMEHRARQFTRRDFDLYDLIVALDPNNRQDLLRLAQTDIQREKIRMLREFDPEGGPRAGVPDPYYGGLDGFEEVYQIVNRACQGLLDHLEAEAQ